MAYGGRVNRIAPDAGTALSTPQLHGPFTRWPRTADTVLAVAIFLLVTLVEFVEPNDDVALRAIGDLSIGALVVISVACGALAWRRSQPVVVLGVTLAAVVLETVFDYPKLIGFVMLVALYSAGRYVIEDRLSYVALGATLATISLTTLITGSSVAELVFGFLFVSVLWYVGRRVRLRGELAARYEREQAAEARRAVVDERTRIARELHDVVAHRVTLMTVQAGAAKTVAAEDPEGALRAMEAVEQAGRQALGELRHLLGVLRPEAEGDGLGPQPGLADVPQLVEQFETAGLAVSLTTEGDLRDLPTRVGLSAYRIVQESLTNVLKHAGTGASAEVRLSTDNHGVAIEVLDNGDGATILLSSGHGIVGMRERALLLGGSLDAGPRPGGGFQIVAYLPIGEEQA